MLRLRLLVCLLAFLAIENRWVIANENSTQPNVIFILVDDLGWGDLGCFHQNTSTHVRKHKTPLLDQMAAEGMQLRAHYCPAPVCAPSRASLLTGVHQGHASVRNNQFDKALIDNHTLGSVMKAAGYKTALIGKYGLQGKGKSSADWPAYPTKRGFDEFFGYVRHVDGHVHYPADKWPLGNSDSHRTGKEVWWNDREVSKELTKCYTTDLFTARSKKWIADHRKANPDQPFFLYLAYDTPHAALQVPTVEYPSGSGLSGGVQWLGEPGKMINTAAGTIDSYRHPEYVGQGWSDVEERFATMVRRIDNAIGDLLQTLKDLEISDNTLVVFTSDNGPHHESYINKVAYEADSFQSYGPYDGTKRDTWEGGIRMPTLAWWPGKIKSGTVNENPSQFHDWMSTMADAAGTVAPARCDGVSLIPSLLGKGTQKPSTVYIEYQQNGRTKRYSHFEDSRKGQKRGQMQVLFQDGFKGIRTDIKSHQKAFSIFDVRQDRGERVDLAKSNDQFVRLQKKMKDSVLRLRILNETAQRPYDDELVPALKKDELVGNADVSWSAYAGQFAYVPQVENLISDSSGKSKGFSAKSKPGVVQFAKNIEIESSGRYRISLSTPTKAFARLHQAGILDADFGYQSGDLIEREMNLESGFHPLRLSVLTDKEGNATAQVTIEKLK